MDCVKNVDECIVARSGIRSGFSRFQSAIQLLLYVAALTERWLVKLSVLLTALALCMRETTRELYAVGARADHNLVKACGSAMRRLISVDFRVS